MKFAIASIVGLVFVGLLVIEAGKFIRGPHVAADDIMAAARGADHQRLSQMVDWSALRSSLARQIRSCTLAAAPRPSNVQESSTQDILLSAAGLFSDLAVEAVVTPDTAALAIKGLPLLKALASKAAPESVGKLPRLVDQSVSWDSASSAYVDLRFRSDSREAIKVRLLMTRNGFSDWLLSGVLLGCS